MLRDELFVDADQIAAAAFNPRLTHSTIWSRYGSAFSGRSIRGTVGLPALSTIRTAPLEICRRNSLAGRQGRNSKLGGDGSVTRRNQVAFENPQDSSSTW